MIWARRRLSWAGYIPYHDHIERLHRSMATACEFMMLARKRCDSTDLDVYVGVPNRHLLRGFDGFAIVNEGDLPKEIDLLLYADRSSGEFQRRFSFRNRRAHGRTASAPGVDKHRAVSGRSAPERRTTARSL